jgi:hypothetical protein
VLGRSPEAHLRIDDPWISNMHALFEQRDDGLWVVDLGSRNGTFLDQERVGEARLSVGSLLGFGLTEVRVEPHGAFEGANAPTRTPTHSEAIHMTARTDRPAGLGAGSAQSSGDADPFRFAVRPVALLRLSVTVPAAGPLPDAAALQAALEAAEQVVRVHGGLTTRLGSAAALAIFGFGGPAPDDKERALAAATAVRTAVHQAAPALLLRLAVDAGPAVVGLLSGQDGAELVALGEVPDRLERLTSAAPPGEILRGPGVGLHAAEADPPG